MNSIKQLATWIKEANRVTVLSGAGISTRSGIPDFRSSSGIWTKDESRTKVMSVSYFHQHQEKFWQFYKEIFGIKLASQYQPNFGHQFLTQLEKEGKHIDIFTQNVDGLHQVAGSKRVFEVHGSLKSATCPKCGETYDLSHVMASEVPRCHHQVKREKTCNNYIPIQHHPANYIDCSNCGTRHDLHGEVKEAIRCKGKKKTDFTCTQVLKPDVVLFGDMIHHFEDARKSLKQADLFLVLGTSLEVYPINELPLLASNGHTKTAIITKEPTELDNWFDIVIHEDICDLFTQISLMNEEEVSF
jgi:NAD-dependent deacetylase